MADYMTRRTVTGSAVINEEVLVQHGEVENTPEGFADVVFEKVFGAEPRVEVTTRDGNNATPSAKAKMVTVSGFRVHFGGDQADVPWADWVAIEKDG